MADPRPLTAVICDLDPWSARADKAVLQEAGFDVIGEAPNAVEAIRITALLEPSLVVITHEQNGLSGLEAVPDLRRNPVPPEVLLIAVDDSAREIAKRDGAFELVVKGDVDMLERILADVRHLLETGERRSSSERRSGKDRREHQDWSKVISERRSGKDRRSGFRRERDVTATAKDILKRKRDS